MKQILPFVVIGIVVLGGLGAAAFSSNVRLKQTINLTTLSMSVQFATEPIFLEKDGFIQIKIEGATTQWLEQHRPVLPVYVKSFEIPYGSTDIKVTCQEKGIGFRRLTKDIIPANLVQLSKLDEQIPYVKDLTVYGSAAMYPSTWYSVDFGAGRNGNNQQVTFVKVLCYPVRYSPLNNLIEYATGFDITMKYTKPDARSLLTMESYDMVIIAPSKFESKLQDLIVFKNNMGVSTIFKSVESILNEYPGADQPEQIKMFIKEAYDTWNITYVLLVGGLKNHIYAKDKDTKSSGWKAWWVPVRYVNMPHADDEGCLSDLYYGCLYNETGAFDSWDSNGDGVYATWRPLGVMNDDIDLYPEVYVSRLPVRSTWEVNHIVKKIIAYESTGPSAKPWFKNFIGIAGKTSYMWNGQPDGEYLCDAAYNYTKLAIPDLTMTNIYSTNRDIMGLIPITADISETMSEGAGFVDFQGHGYALGWNTIWFDGSYPDDWTGGIGVDKFWKIQNGDKQPVVVVGGCHNGLYNISILTGMIDKEGKQYFCHGLPGLVCFSWGLVIKPFGGAIASTGSTGYGVGTMNDNIDPSTVLSSALELNFFYEIGHGATHLAQAHSQAISKYINEHTIGNTDAFCITNWALFGDPSLMFGGYSS